MKYESLCHEFRAACWLTVKRFDFTAGRHRGMQPYMKKPDTTSEAGQDLFRGNVIYREKNKRNSAAPDLKV